jgi:Transposase DDE domain
MNDPDAKLEDLAAPLGIALQSLHERLDFKAVDCLRRVLRKAMALVFTARPETIPLLRRFTEVVLEDSTTVSLPASLAGEYPGCGGSSPEAGKAAAKIMAQIEVITGEVRLVEPAPGRASDRTLHASLPPLPPGSLRLTDLGFFDLERLDHDTKQEIFWISRVPARLKVESDGERALNVSEWLQRRTSDRVDTLVTLGSKGQRLKCRLVALRTPPEVAKLRLERLERNLKKKGRKLSEAQRVLCQWTVMITNLIDTVRFSAEQLWVLYRVRWQIELMFKRWKSGGGLGRSRGRLAYRVLCEFMAKLLAVLIKHWATLLRGGPLCVVSATRASARVKWWAGRIAEALSRGDLGQVVQVLKLLKKDLDSLPKRPRRARPTTRQQLFAPRLVA